MLPPPVAVLVVVSNTKTISGYLNGRRNVFEDHQVAIREAERQEKQAHHIGWNQNRPHHSIHLHAVVMAMVDTIICYLRPSCSGRKSHFPDDGITSKMPLFESQN